MALHVFAPERLAEQVVRGLRATLPAGLHLLDAAQVALVEVERLLRERVRQPGRRRREQLPAQVRAPRRKRRRGQLLLHLSEELRLLDVQVRARQPGLAEVGRPIEMRRLYGE